MITFILLNGVYIKLEAVDAEDIRYLVTYLMDGLRERSTYAVAVQAHEGIILCKGQWRVFPIIVLYSKKGSALRFQLSDRP